MTTTDSVFLAKELISKYDELKRWEVSLNRRKRSFGVCNYTDEQIQLSSVLIPEMTDKAIFETIIHEIAHALTRGHGHDYVWRRKCIELGGDGERVGNHNKFENGKLGEIEYRKKMSKYTLTCPVCGEQSYVNRLPKRACSCGKHGRGYNPMYKMIVSQNN